MHFSLAVCVCMRVCAGRPQPRPCLRKDYLDKLDKHLLHDRTLTEDGLYACTPGDSLLSVRALCAVANSLSACHGVCLSETGNNRHERPRAFQNTPCRFSGGLVSPAVMFVRQTGLGQGSVSIQKRKVLKWNIL